MFPRLDERVTTGMDHLLKSVFAVHPSTKRVSVPIPDIDTWQPHMAPRISEVVPPLDAAAPDSSNFWILEKVARERAMVLTPYIHHLQEVVQRAYPYKPRGIVAPTRLIKTTKLV
jgi:hypothetical protein